MNTDFLYLALSEEKLDDCILHRKFHWTKLRRNDCKYVFIADAKKNILPHIGCAVQ